MWVTWGQWFSPGTPISSTNKTDCHVITEILLKGVLNTITLTSHISTRRIKSPASYVELSITDTGWMQDCAVEVLYLTKMSNVFVNLCVYLICFWKHDIAILTQYYLIYAKCLGVTVYQWCGLKSYWENNNLSVKI